jgi:flagellar hook assembly protein FlgD
MKAGNVKIRVVNINGCLVNEISPTEGADNGNLSVAYWDRLDRYGKRSPPGSYIIQIVYVGHQYSTRVQIFK